MDKEVEALIRGFEVPTLSKPPAPKPKPAPEPPPEPKVLVKEAVKMLPNGMVEIVNGDKPFLVTRAEWDKAKGDLDTLELWSYINRIAPNFWSEENRLDRTRKEQQKEEILSMVHWQRDSMAAIWIDADRNLKPYKVSLLLMTSNLEIYKGYIPFEMYLRFEDGETVPEKYQQAYEMGASYKTFLRLFDLWYRKANLGVTPFQVPVKILPLFANEKQFFLARDLWTPSVFETVFEKPYRIMTSIAAFENDKSSIQGKQRIQYGKHTWTQVGARLQMKVPVKAEGIERCMYMIKIYKKLVQTSQV